MSSSSTRDAQMALVANSGDLQPSLQNILDQKSLKWIFVGGKGGVGKTTNSCSLAIQLSKVRKSVLLISTDPAHNLSDAFGQQFGKDPTLITGFENLFAMEIDPSAGMQEVADPSDETAVGNMFQDLAFSIPGVDEAMGFAEVMKLVKSMEFDVIVFDTAPTGHTLRFLSFPAVLEKALGRIKQFSGRFTPLLDQMSSLFGGGAASGADMFSKLDGVQSVIKEVNSQFQDSSKTTFVCVCISEFLSLYETERMIQELDSYNIDTHNIIVNQLLDPSKDSTCGHCAARRKMQKKYLGEIESLYPDFHIIKLPLLTGEIRGKADIDTFSTKLVQPWHFFDTDGKSN